MYATSSGERLHGMDAVRGFALLLGVVLHATMSFLPGPQIWVVADSSRSTTLAITFFVIHLMRMTLFFLIAGFFGRMVFHRIGALSFVRDRLRRIALPLVVGWPLVFASIVAVLIAASADAASGPPTPSLSPKNFPLTHLWFLYVLLILYAMALLVRSVIARVDRQQGFRRLIDVSLRAMLGPWAALVLMIPVAMALYLHPYWVMWFGVPTPDMSLTPNRAALVTYGTSFTVGWLVNRQSLALLSRWERQWPWHLAVAVIATLACLGMFGLEPVLMPAPQGTRKLIGAVLYSLALWSWTFAILGIGLRFLASRSPWRRYLADASYWIYIAHLPLVMALQLVVAPWPLAWPIKFAGVLTVALALLLLSYDLLVRSTCIGATLNGRRHPRAIASLHLRGSTIMRTMLLSFVLLPAVVQAQSVRAPEPLSLETAIARHKAAVGPVQRVQSRRMKMRISGMAPFEIPVVVDALRPNLIRRTATIQGASHVTVYDGQDAWRLDPFVPGGDKPIDVPASELADLIEESDFDGPLYDPAAKGHQVRYAGPRVVTVGTRQLPVHSLDVTFKDGRTTMIHLDATTFLEAKRVQTRPVMGKDTEIDVIASDYRPVNGITMPHLIEIAPKGLPTPIRIVIESVEWNPALDRRTFSRSSVK